MRRKAGCVTVVLLSIALVAYVAGIVLAAVALFQRSAPSRGAASVAWAVAWSGHLAAIVLFVLEAGRLPLSSLGEFLLTLGWAVLTLHLTLWFRQRMDGAGLVLPPLAALSAAVALGLVTAEGVDVEMTPRPLFLFHTSVSTLGMAMLCVAFAMAVLYLLQDRALKQRKTLRLIERLPALAQCDQLGFQSMLVGFVLLSLGIGTGLMVNAAVHERWFTTDPKQIFGTAAWAVFAVLLVLRAAMGFRGRKSAYATIAGFALGLMTVLGMTL